jgi:orotate phosphoribosyltransferase
MADLNELKQEYIEAVYKTEAFMIKEEPFDLQSGGKSHIYLNHRIFLSRYNYIDLIARIYLKLLAPLVKHYRLCAVDSVMSPILVGAMSVLDKKDIVVVKSKKSEHGMKDDIYGRIADEIVVVDDLSSTGKTLLEAARKIREKGGLVRYAVVSACRDQRAHENLSKEKLELLSITSFREIIDYLNPRLNPREKELVSGEFPE